MIVYLEYRTWAGFTPDASHYYGHLVFKQNGETEKIDLQRKITSKKECAMLNKKDNNIPLKSVNNAFKHQVGDETTRFDSLQDLIKQAKKDWKNIVPHGTLLVLGESYVADPQEPIDAKKKSNLNKAWDIYHRFSKNEYSKKIVEEWDNFIQKEIKNG